MLHDYANDYVTLIQGDYYSVVSNDNVGLPSDYILVELGPHHGWYEVSRYEDLECPF